MGQSGWMGEEWDAARVSVKECDEGCGMSEGRSRGGGGREMVGKKGERGE
ncbi:hypothetical protein SNUCP2_02350 [Clostridium perfringens A]